MEKIKTERLTRRGLLLAAAAGGAWASVSAAMATPQCFDPATLTPEQKKMRTALAFVPASPDPEKTCGGCAFFVEADLSDCGVCRVLNGPVETRSHCSSWAPRQ